MQAADVVQAAGDAPAVLGPVGGLGGEPPEDLQRPAVRLQRPGRLPELRPDLADAGRGPRRLGPRLRVVGPLAGELLVEGQRLLEESRWSGVSPSFVRQPLLGDLGVHLVDRLACVAALAVGLGEAVAHLGQGRGGPPLGVDGPDRLATLAARPATRATATSAAVVSAARLRRANFRTGTTPTAGTPPPAGRSGAASRRPRSRWPSRTAACGPSPAPSSRSSRARPARHGSAAAGRTCRLRRDRRERRRPACSAACSASAAPPRG